MHIQCHNQDLKESLTTEIRKVELHSQFLPSLISIIYHEQTQLHNPV